MMSKTESVTVQMKDLLDTYTEGVAEVVEESAEAAAELCVTKLRQTSPKGPRGYAGSWTARKRDGSWIVYNEKHYQLTHLLENGHASYNQYGGSYRDVPAHKHIAPVEQEGIRGFELRLNRGLNDL